MVTVRCSDPACAISEHIEGAVLGDDGTGHWRWYCSEPHWLWRYRAALQGRAATRERQAMGERQIQAGDRVQIADTDISGRAEPDGIAVNVITEDGQAYRVPETLLWWRPPPDDPVFAVGDEIRGVPTPGSLSWWYLPDSTTDAPFITVTKLGDKMVRHYYRRDELPDRLQVVTPGRNGG